MKVTDAVVEGGKATWDPDSVSVRHSDPKSIRGLDLLGLRDLQLFEIPAMVRIAAERDLLDCATIRRMIEVLSASLARQG